MQLKGQTWLFCSQIQMSHEHLEGSNLTAVLSASIRPNISLCSHRLSGENKVDSLYLCGKVQTTSGKPRDSLCANDFTLDCSLHVDSNIKNRASFKTNLTYVCNSMLLINVQISVQLCLLIKHTRSILDLLFKYNTAAQTGLALFLGMRNIVKKKITLWLFFIDIAFVMWVMISGNYFFHQFSLPLRRKLILIRIMWHILASVPNKNVFLHTYNICIPAHLCSTTTLYHVI